MARFAATNSICVRTHNIVLVKVSNVSSTAVLVLAKSDSDSVRKLDFYYIQNSSDLAHFFMNILLKIMSMVVWGRGRGYFFKKKK